MFITADTLILGNWKMHLSRQTGVGLARQVADATKNAGAKVQVGICPPAPYLLPVGEAIQNTNVLLGAQDCHYKAEGAYTGDVSAPMLRDAGCHFTLTGHSERRKFHHETDAEIFEKTAAAIAGGLHAVICVGETDAEREAGDYLQLIETQIRKALPESGNRGNVTIAYEPVWAIGTGKTASTDDIEEVHSHIQSVLRRLCGDEMPRVLYGGSVKANNALEILSLPMVDGVLVGGASLDAAAFAEIINAATNA